MNLIFGWLIILSFIIGGVTGNISLVSLAVINESQNAVELVFRLAGTICFWSGIMKIAEKSKICDKIAVLISPFINMIFDTSDLSKNARLYITMNITSNLLGLGNASTPLALLAMKEMDKCNKNKQYASNNMIIFVVLNTASIQIIPTTVGAIRANYGSDSPFIIIPAVIICSLCSVTVGLITAKILSRIRGVKYD